MANPTPAQVAQARKSAEEYFNMPTSDADDLSSDLERLTWVIAAALATAHAEGRQVAATCPACGAKAGDDCQSRSGPVDCPGSSVMSATPPAPDREALVKALLESVEDFRRIDAIYEKDRVAHVYGHQIEKILDKWLHDDETTPDVLARLRAPTPTGETR